MLSWNLVAGYVGFQIRSQYSWAIIASWISYAEDETVSSIVLAGTQLVSAVSIVVKNVLAISSESLRQTLVAVKELANS